MLVIILLCLARKSQQYSVFFNAPEFGLYFQLEDLRCSPTLAANLPLLMFSFN